MHQPPFLTFLLLTGLLAAANPARAERYESPKRFGIGLELGAPTGLSGKYFLGGMVAVQGGIGVVESWSGRDRDVPVYELQRSAAELSRQHQGLQSCVPLNVDRRAPSHEHHRSTADEEAGSEATRFRSTEGRTSAPLVFFPQLEAPEQPFERLAVHLCDPRRLVEVALGRA